MTAWQPTASIATLKRRACIVDAIRRFFADRRVTEVQTPVMTRDGVTDVHIDSLALADQAGYLRTSPEYCHKRLLAAGFGDLYELGPVFRAGETGRFHRTEFTLLEWYRVGWSWQQLAAEVLDLIEHCRESTDGTRLHAEHIEWQACFAALDGLDPLACSDTQLRRLCPELAGDCDRDMVLDYLFATRIQPHFPVDSVRIVHSWPASQAALARIDPQDSRLAERFEVFIGPLELANGYRELTDASQQRQRFERDNQRRKDLQRTTMPSDERLLAALAHGLPDCAGVAVGLERLIMALTAISDIAEVQAFGNEFD